MSSEDYSHSESDSEDDDEIVVMEAEVLRVEKAEKMAYFDLRANKYLWQPTGF